MIDLVSAAIPPTSSSVENDIAILRKLRRDFSFGCTDSLSGSILSTFVLGSDYDPDDDACN